MLNLSLAKCIAATENGVFSTKLNDFPAELSVEDIEFLAEYLLATPLTTINLTLHIDEENFTALPKLGQVIGSKGGLTKLHFELSELSFVRNFPGIPILSYFDNRRLSKINNYIIDAVNDMLENKPQLQHVLVDLEAIELPASAGQADTLARNLSRCPLQSLDVALAVEEHAKLPIIARHTENNTLTDVKIRHTINGKNVLEHLKNAHSIKELQISGMSLSASDLPALDEVLKVNPKIGYLTLSQMNIGQIDSRLIFDRLKQSPALIILDLSQCDLSRFNVDPLCEYVSSSSCQLTELDLSKNAYMGNEMAKIAEALRSASQLEKLSVNGNYIEDQGLHALIQLCKYNKKISSLSISKTCRIQPSDEVIQELAAFLKDPNCQLTELEFEQKLSIDQLILLSEAIVSNKRLTRVDLQYKGTGVLAMFCKAQIMKHLYGEYEESDAQTEDLIESIDPDNLSEESSADYVLVPPSFVLPDVAEEEQSEESELRVSM